MAFTVTKHITNFPRAGNPRAAANVANATLVFALSQAKTAAGCATATVTSKVKTANTLTFTVNGVFFSLNATDNFWTLSGTVVPAGSFQKYALLVDTAGAASIQEATSNTVSAATVVWSNVGQVTAVYPFLTTVGSTKAVVGVLTVATDATHTFTPGTTLLGAAGITATYIDGLDQSLIPLNGDYQGTVYGSI